jgi:hypothetical protein
MLHTLRFSFQNDVYCSNIIHILLTECAKILNVKLQCQKVTSAGYINVNVICHVMKDSLESLISKPYYLDSSLINRPISKPL